MKLGRRVPAGRRPYRSLSKYVAAAIERIKPDVRRAVSAEVVAGAMTAREYWDRVERRLAELYVVGELLGHVSQRRSFLRDGLIRKKPPETQDISTRIQTFSVDSQRELLDLPFLEALRVFEDEVPSLNQIIEGSQRRAIATASETVIAQRTATTRLVAKLQADAVSGLVVGGESVTTQAVRDAVARVVGDTVVARLDTETHNTVMHAYNEGAKEQVRANADAVPILELSEIQDRRTRGNPRGEYPDAGPHYQMDGFAAPVDDPIWDRITPPNGHNCRASVRGVGLAEARRRRWTKQTATGEVVDVERMRDQFARQWSLIEANEYPDPGFGGLST